MKKLIILLLVIVSLLFSNSAQAAFSFDLQESGTDGVFNIVFELGLTDPPAEVNTYTLGFLYDPTELAFVSYTHIPLPGMMGDMFGPMVVDSPAPGFLSNFNVFAMAPAILPSNSSTLLGTLTFDILPGATQDGSPDLQWNLNDSLFVYQVYGDNYSFNLGNLPEGLSMTPIIDVGTSAVPVPSSILLLGGGLFALLGISRRKS